MKISFYYQMRFLPTKRHRKARIARIRHEQDIAIAAPDACDFPVAFVVHDYKSVCSGAKTWSDFEELPISYELGSEEIRSYGGKLFRPLYIRHGAAVSTEYETEQYVASKIESFASLGVGCTLCVDEDEIPTTAIIQSNDLSNSLEMAQQEASQYVFFNGHFWEACGEPRYLVQTFGLGFNHGGTSIFIEYRYNPNIAASAYFSALERQRAIDKGIRTAQARGDTEDIPRIQNTALNIDVRMPELVLVDPANQHGDGNPFLADLEGIVESAKDPVAAGLACILLALG